MFHLNSRTKRFTPIDLFASLTVSCNLGNIGIKADGNNIIIRLPSLRAAFMVLTLLEGGRSFAETMQVVDQALKQADLTLFWQNHHFAILGSKAKPYLLKILIGVQKVTKLSALGGKRRGRSH